MNVGMKVEKNLYEDVRDDKATGVCIRSAPGALHAYSYPSSDTMDKWDEEKLRTVVLSKHGNPRTTTDV